MHVFKVSKKFLFKLYDIENSNTGRQTDSEEAAQYKPPHSHLHCFPCSLWILSMKNLGGNIFLYYADKNFVICYFGALILLHSE